MSSLHRITALRTNGALSRGPTKPVTCRLSAANSLLHGFVSRHGRIRKSVVLSNESHDRSSNCSNDISSVSNLGTPSKLTLCRKWPSPNGPAPALVHPNRHARS